MDINPIEEIKRIRHDLGASVDYDVSRLFADLKDQWSRQSRAYVEAPTRASLEKPTRTQSKKTPYSSRGAQ